MTRPVVIFRETEERYIRVMCGREGQGPNEAAAEARTVMRLIKVNKPNDWQFEDIEDYLVSKGWFAPEWADATEYV